MAIVFSFIIHTKITISWILEFVELTLNENPENWYLTKLKPSLVINFEYENRSIEAATILPISNVTRK